MQPLLVLDSFQGHVTENVWEQLHIFETRMAVIPGGMTSMLQPLEISVNYPFKCRFCSAYTKWKTVTIYQRILTSWLKAVSLTKVHH